MLTSVEARTTQGVLLQLPLPGDFVTTGIFVQKIEGLDPVKATIVTSTFADLDGSEFQSSSRGSRNIVMTLGLDPFIAGGNARTIRNQLYQFFMPKSDVLLSFVDSDEPLVEISGTVESFESDLFTDKPTVTISIMCFDSDFYSPTTLTFNGSSSSNPLIEAEIDYDGTVETGFIFRLFPTRAVLNFEVYLHRSNDLPDHLYFTEDLAANDILTIVSIPGSKRVTLTRAGVDSSVLYGLAAASAWLKLYPGSNFVRVYEEGGSAIPFTLEYSNKYGGL